MMTPEQHKRLSKFLSLVLRHEPERLGLHLDDEGAVLLADLLAAVHRKHGWEQVTEAQIREVVASSEKQRFEITGDRIRARYGHSVPQTVTYPEVQPPEILYHGTSPKVLPAIRTAGLQPMGRQYVHLSTQIDQARLVGRRHAPDPVVLSVRARAAEEAGVRFYQPEERLFLSTPIPPAFIDPHPAERD
jgi:putative RNA 2'-phosphotransferase